MTARPDSPERSEGAVHPVGALALAYLTNETLSKPYLFVAEAQSALADAEALQSALAAMTAENATLKAQAAALAGELDRIANGDNPTARHIAQGALAAYRAGGVK